MGRSLSNLVQINSAEIDLFGSLDYARFAFDGEEVRNDARAEFVYRLTELGLSMPDAETALAAAERRFDAAL